MEEDDSTQYELILGGLKAETLYSVSVAAYTTKGDGAHSKAKLVRTTGIVPGPPSLWVRPQSATSVVVRWSPPLDCPETAPDNRGTPLEIKGYHLQYGLKNSSLNTTEDFSPRERNFTVGNLTPGSSYLFVLAAINRVGYGDAAQQEIDIPISPPSGYPKLTDFVNATCCSLQFFWLPLAPDECNSVITEYTVAYKQAAAPRLSADPVPSVSPAPSAPPWLITLPASESSYTIVGLNHSTAYEVQLRAHNKAGPGPFSPALLCLTLAFETGRPGEHLSASKHWFSFTSPPVSYGGYLKTFL
ncbi:receptor-type tyrosine-protein phosphatase delta-like [Nothobranchius furzeri]|uniref:Receptor-type tyrosine-protein phosphatase delta-like n=1 Tax=Nothobranchius furzeri TaxID=105023 RepID=A0A9D2YNR6_NOTFU|nr:receptor-type tyrosine-protein phosphatase delta-like [Nothobranchius furzeri]